MTRLGKTSIVENRMNRSIGVMKKYIAGYATDIGSTKSINQDSLCIRKALLNGEEVLIVVVCDGMGGLSKGEVASAAVVQAFAENFVTEIVRKISNQEINKVKEEWRQLILALNEKIWRYGEKEGKQAGSTLTAVLLFKNQYIVAQVGDSRAYIIGDNVRQITEDQSVIAREIKKGNLTETQAIHDPRRNILLECVGVSNHVHPDFYEGYIQQGEGVLVCTDGFWREQNTEQLKDNLPKNNKTELEIKQILHRLISENIEKGEKDNISAVYVQQSEEGA